MSRIANAGAVGLGLCIGLGGFALLGLLRFPGDGPTAWRRAPVWPPPPPTSVVHVRVAGDRPVAVVDQRFLSFAVDTAEVVGGEFWAPPGAERGLLGTHTVAPYDFRRPRLRRLAGALAPAYLRIGGTDADRTVYRLDRRQQSPSPALPPPGARFVLTSERWDEVNAFAEALDLRIVFTVNAGPSARDASGDWDPESARGLLEYSQARHYPVAVWELGNEVNAFPLTHWRWLGADRYAGDLRRARALLDELHAPGLLAGGGSAFWPVVGEGRAITEDTLRAAGDVLDVVTWHYYPQQSHRCPLATRRADLDRTSSPARLGEIDRWAAEVETQAHAHAPRAAVWLGETASAQCGGEPGISNTYADALWWLDELGRLARRGEQVVIRQTLSGSDYGLIDDQTLEPNPSYWASWLWRQLMGSEVLDVEMAPPTPVLRAYAHRLRGGGFSARGDGRVEGDENADKDRDAGTVILLINLHPTSPVTVDLGPGLDRDGDRLRGRSARVFRFDATELASRQARLDGRVLAAAADGSPPVLPRSLAADQGPVDGPRGTLSLPPRSVAFVVLAAE